MSGARNVLGSTRFSNATPCNNSALIQNFQIGMWYLIEMTQFQTVFYKTTMSIVAGHLHMRKLET